MTRVEAIKARLTYYDEEGLNVTAEGRVLAAIRAAVEAFYEMDGKFTDKRLGDSAKLINIGVIQYNALASICKKLGLPKEKPVVTREMREHMKCPLPPYDNTTNTASTGESEPFARYCCVKCLRSLQVVTHSMTDASGDCYLCNTCWSLWQAKVKEFLHGK